MRHFHTLSTEKFYEATLREEKKAYHRLRNIKAFRDFFTFVFGLAAMALGVFIAENYRVWMPYVSELQSNVMRLFS